MSTSVKTLSLLIPVYNEEKSIAIILKKISEVELPGGVHKEIVIINDASSDQSHEIIQRFMSDNPDMKIRYLMHAHNKGKGASIRTGIKEAQGDYIILQDADLEYDPHEIGLLLKPVLDGHADVVYGSRFLGGKAHRILFFWHSIGNKFLTFLSNITTGLNLTDLETCYKLFKSELIKNMPLKEDRFGFEPEVTAKISKVPDVRIYEVGVSYYGRTFKEGKKIGWRDGFRAIYCIIKYSFYEYRIR